jgi:DNA polymerase-1
MNKLANESALSTALAAAKLRGLKLDAAYCAEAMAYELKQSEAALEEIKKTVNLNVNSPKQLQKYLREDLGLELPKIIKRGKWTGGYSTDAKTLDKLAEKYDMPMFQKIITAKRSQKKANTYYKNFLKLKDAADIIHCGLGQETTVTGRLSSFSPNLQNIHKEKYHEWAVRNAFINRDGFKLYFFDYKGQEMYIMIDLSGDETIIKKVADGTDIYIAMAEMVKQYTGIEITRAQAKALALGVAYGQGAALIASNLGCSIDQAKKLKKAFLTSLRGVSNLDQWCKKQAERYGKIHNPYGRVTMIDKGFEYKTLNALIQGTAADCTKKAFVDCTEYLQDYESKVVLTVHDEIIVEIKDGEEFLVPEIKRIMTEAYPQRSLPLRVDVEMSESSWAAKKEIVS